MIARALVLGFLTCYSGIAAELMPGGLDECMQTEGKEYLRAVSNVIMRSDATQLLTNIAASQDMDISRRRTASILLVRMERPMLFTDLVKCIADIRRKPDYGRGGYFEGTLIQFTRTGPESTFVWASGARILTQHGWDREDRKVAKYTDRDVQEGKSRNAAARLVVIEYFLKFRRDLTDYYEIPEFMGVLRRLEYGDIGKPGGKLPEYSMPTADIFEELLTNETENVHVRVAAVSRLTEDSLDKAMVCRLMAKVLQAEKITDDRRYRATVETATRFLLLHGGPQNLAFVKGYEPDAEWKRQLVKEAIKDVEVIKSCGTVNKVP